MAEDEAFTFSDEEPVDEVVDDIDELIKGVEKINLDDEEFDLSPDAKTEEERIEEEFEALYKQKEAKKGKKERPERRKIEYKNIEPDISGYDEKEVNLRPEECVICGKTVDDISTHTIEKHPISYYNYLLPHCTCLDDTGKPTKISNRAKEYFDLIKKYKFPEVMKKMKVSRMCCRSRFAGPVVLPMIDRNRDRFIDTVSKKRMDTALIVIDDVPDRPIIVKGKKTKKGEDKRRNMAPEL
jgi:DNA-directed RNA polymerase subunit N (RpoN/RPB10)